MPGEEAAGAIAIVVLGAGGYFNAPEYGRDTVNRMTLEQLGWAAQPYRGTQIPIRVSGERPLGNACSEAKQMRDSLVEYFATPVRCVETNSRNTYESAYNTTTLLGAQPAQIVLATRAAHMPRACLVFRHAGFGVIPAATGFTTSPPDKYSRFPARHFRVNRGANFLSRGYRNWLVPSSACMWRRRAPRLHGTILSIYF